MLWSGWANLDVTYSLRTAGLNAMGHARPKGLHLSGIIRARRVAAGLPQEAPEGDQESVRLQEGFLWETVVEYMVTGCPFDEAISLAFKRWLLHLRTGVVTQLKLEREGVHMTPDAFIPEQGVIESYKVTRKKMPHDQGAFESGFWPWLEAEQAYCLAVGVDTCDFYVLFQAGDYSKGLGSGPRMVKSRCTWTQEELEENWQKLMAYREYAKEE